MLEVDSHWDRWEAARRGDCGISCVCLYDTDTFRYHTYAAKPDGDWDDRDIDALFEHLNSADVLVGFNSVAHDTPACIGYFDRDITPEHYDLMTEVWKGLGTRAKGYGLGPICERLGLGKKNLKHNESAPQLYADGRFGHLIDYCIGDVHLTRNLANHINTHGHILSPLHEPVPVNPLGVPA